jgi:hypothetical protein
LDRGSLQALLFLKGGVIMGLKFVWEPISDNEGGYSLSSFIDESEYLFIAPLWSILEFFQLMRESEDLTKKGFDKYFQHNTMAMRGLRIPVMANSDSGGSRTAVRMMANKSRSEATLFF